MQNYFGSESEYASIYDIPTPALPDLKDQDSPYVRLILTHECTPAERLILALALVPYLDPRILDTLLITDPVTNRPHTIFGGQTGRGFQGFLPTIQTALFLFGDGVLHLKMQLQLLFQEDHFFRKENIIEIYPAKKGEPIWSAKFSITQKYLSRLITGSPITLRHTPKYSATRLTTELEWSDLVLSPPIKAEIQKIADWINHEDTILNQWKFKKHLDKGYTALFYGSPGTGKTLSATLLNKLTDRAVYRISLSQIISKYIGETEKNLNQIFDQALNQNSILFFDEADALFGRRTAKDQPMSRESAYLLQRIEDYSGVVVLASNLKMNIDDALAKRFQSIIHFPIPDAQQRLTLWNNIFASHPILDETVKLEALAIKYEIAPGAMINVLRYCTLLAAKKESQKISHADLEKGIVMEIAKEGKVL